MFYFKIVGFGDAIYLIICALDKIFSKRHIETFFLFFSQKTGFDISCKLSEFLILVSWENENITTLSSAELEVKVKQKGVFFQQTRITTVMFIYLFKFLNFTSREYMVLYKIDITVSKNEREKKK